MLDAEVVVASLVLPELFEWLALKFAELVRLLLDGHLSTEKSVQQVLLKPQL